jgi:L-lysine exporter family protein LysE/ArgO
VTTLRVGGAVFLAGYGVLAGVRAMHPSASGAEAGVNRSSSLASAGTTALALTWLNPHVYLDTVVVLGSVANSHGGGRAWFGAGAMLASVIWFSALGYGARWLRPILTRPASWRVLDAAIAAVMFVLAFSFVAEGFGA